MAFEDVSTKGMNYTTLRQVIDDYLITMDGDDYASNASDAAIRNIALRGLREFGFDVTARVKSIKRTVESNNTVTLPDDYVDLVKLGVVDGEGILRVFNQNKNVNYSRRILQDTSADPNEPQSVIADTVLTTDSDAGPLDLANNLILNREDDKGATSSSTPDSGDLDFYVFENYLFQGGLGRLYGAGGGYAPGEYRINLDQNRIEIATDSETGDVVLEYISDEARSTNPVVHVYAEEALRCYIYYKLCERKSTIPSNEKLRARAEYYNERRKAKARLSSFTKEEALKTIRKNFRLAPKY
tara:strand:- start:28638 stop:29534 length:897 start_codon:yes stop_codon:yes gene_type:complete